MIELGATKNVSETTPRVPFPAIVGQDALKEALLVTGANDTIGGLLIRGEKGTAKSTAARGLPALLPQQRAVADCPFGCPPDDPDAQCRDCRDRPDPAVETRPVPFVTLPLGASRERVAGTLSVKDALEGSAEFDPGLLARANRGILYVDEVNLLDDHLVDVLLDAAASGVNHVERDGVSVTHPADITLVGTMNPEEGDLRPQFRDRFDLQVEVQGSEDIEKRVAVLEGALSGFDESVDAETAALRERVQTARECLDRVSVPESLLVETAELCRDAGVEGHRGDIATVRAARTIAALDGRERVIEPDIQQAATFALPHRLQSRPFEETPDPEDVVDDHFDDDTTEAEGSPSEQESDNSHEGEKPSEGEDSGERDTERNESRQCGDDESESATEQGQGTDADSQGEDDTTGDADQAPTDGESGDGPQRTGTETTAGGESSESDTEETDGDSDATDSEDATPLVPGQSRAAVGAASPPSVDPNGERGPETETPISGTRTETTATARGTGARVRTEQADDGPIDAPASVRAAAARGAETVESRDLRQSVRANRASALVVFALDASASMRGPMRAGKGVAMELLQDAYEQRDEVAVVTFAGEDGDVVLPPTDSVPMAARHLKQVPTGDRTPLSAGLQTAGDVLSSADPAVGVVVLVTDGRANAGAASPTDATRQAAQRLAAQDAHVVVVDAGDSTDRTTLTAEVTEITDGERIPLDALTAEHVDSAVVRANLDEH
jgi:magnesium chelatase subunit D